MRVQLFGVGTKSTSPAITAQSRVNCYVEQRKEQDRTVFSLVGRPGLTSFITSLGSSPSRGLWAVNTLAAPLLFTVHSGTLYSVTNAGVISTIGTIGTLVGDVSMADDGKYLVLVDGLNGYWYNMQTPGALTKITDGNFTTTPKTVTWQDNYFIVTSGSNRQFQLSQISPSVDPSVWPAVQINFSGSGAGALQAGLADHSILNLFGDVYTEFWQDTGTPDFPYAIIPSAAAEFGLIAPDSLSKFDNSIAGLFQNKMGAISVSRMSGFRLQKLSDSDMDAIFKTYTASSIGSAEGFAFMIGGHPIYFIRFNNVASWMYDGYSNVWTEVRDPSGQIFWGKEFAIFQGRSCVSDYRNGNIYQFDTTTYTDNGSTFPMEVVSKHIWNDDKYIGISQIQVDIESGDGLVSGQGVNPQMDLLVSKDGGNTFTSIGFSSMGAIGQFTTRVAWRSLGAARDWVLKLRITDPIKRVITGASAEMVGGPF